MVGLPKGDSPDALANGDSPDALAKGDSFVALAKGDSLEVLLKSDSAAGLEAANAPKPLDPELANEPKPPPAAAPDEAKGRELPPFPAVDDCPKGAGVLEPKLDLPNWAGPRCPKALGAPKEDPICEGAPNDEAPGSDGAPNEGWERPPIAEGLPNDGVDDGFANAEPDGLPNPD